MRDEIHASHMINKGHLAYIRRNDRLNVIRHLALELSSSRDLSLINIVVDKQGKAADYDVFNNAWTALIQRFHNTFSSHDFPGPCNPDERGILFPDNTDNRRLLQLMRRMTRYNPVPSRITAGYRNLPLDRLVEDPSMRDSGHSLFIQATDVAAFLLYQYIQPCSYIRRKSARRMFLTLDPILCKVASSSDPHGIVWL
jgi:hypothetical protein